jgi:putative transposase
MSYYKLQYHLVWHTKYNAPLIRSDIEQAIHDALSNKAKDLGGHVFAVGGLEDHVHLLTSIPPTIAVCEFVRFVKGYSAHAANQRLELDYVFKWQGGYGAFCFGPGDLPRLISYVRHQRKHHSQKTLRPHLELS